MVAQPALISASRPKPSTKVTSPSVTHAEINQIKIQKGKRFYWQHLMNHSSRKCCRLVSLHKLAAVTCGAGRDSVCPCNTLLTTTENMVNIYYLCSFSENG